MNIFFAILNGQFRVVDERRRVTVRAQATQERADAAGLRFGGPARVVWLFTSAPVNDDDRASVTSDSTVRAEGRVLYDNDGYAGLLLGVDMLSPVDTAASAENRQNSGS